MKTLNQYRAHESNDLHALEVKFQYVFVYIFHVCWILKNVFDSSVCFNLKTYYIGIVNKFFICFFRLSIYLKKISFIENWIYNDLKKNNTLYIIMLLNINRAYSKISIYLYILDFKFVDFERSKRNIHVHSTGFHIYWSYKCIVSVTLLILFC